jgi:hypothetical protein
MAFLVLRVRVSKVLRNRTVDGAVPLLLDDGHGGWRGVKTVQEKNVAERGGGRQRWRATTRRRHAGKVIRRGETRDDGTLVGPSCLYWDLQKKHFSATR